MFYMRVEGTDCIPVHARPPQCMARQVGVSLVAEDLAVDLEIRDSAPLLPPQRVLPERPVLGVEIFLPQRRRLDDMAVAVEHYEILGSHPFLRLYASPLVNVIVARRAMQSRCVASQSRRDCVALAVGTASLRLPDRRLGPQRSADFLFRWPPVRAIDLGDALADDVDRRLHVIEAPGVGAQEFGLILLRQAVCLHRLHRAPGVVAVVVVDVGRPAQDVAIELRQSRRRRLVPFEAGHAMLEESLARELLQRRQLPFVAVEAVGLVALVDQEAEPGRGRLENRRIYFWMPVKEARHQYHRDPECRLRLEILYIRQEGMRQPRCRNRAADQLGAGILLAVA